MFRTVLAIITDANPRTALDAQYRAAFPEAPATQPATPAGDAPAPAPSAVSPQKSVVLAQHKERDNLVEATTTFLLDFDDQDGVDEFEEFRKRQLEHSQMPDAKRTAAPN